jgi:integrase
MTVLSALDSAGRRRSPATMPGYHAGRPPRNKGMRYPADPPTVEEIVAVMRHAADDRHGWRLRAMIVVLWRAGLRVQEALALAELDLDPRRGSVLVRNGKGGRRREVGMDEWGWEHLRPWLSVRAELPVGPLFCIIDGPTRGRPWSGAAVRSEFRRLAAQAGVRRRFAPHQLRHAHALELAREGVPLNIIQRQLGHANLGTTSIYLQGIDPEEIIATVRTRRAPMMSASAGLLIERIITRERSGAPASPGKRRCTASRRPPRSSATLSPIGLAQEPYWPAASALTGGPWSPASWKIAGTSGSAMNFS